MPVPALINALVLAMTVLAYGPYIRDILRGRTKPHAMTWCTATLTAFVVYGLQALGGAGIGALPVLFVGTLCACIFLLSLYYGTADRAAVDVVFLLLSLSALALWLLAERPIVSVLLITASEILGYAPTMRKSWRDPRSETLSLYAVNALRQGLSILALERVNLLTTLYPAEWAVANLVIAGILILGRRRERDSSRRSPLAEPGR